MSHINRNRARQTGTNRATQAEISNVIRLSFPGLVTALPVCLVFRLAETERKFSQMNRFAYVAGSTAEKRQIVQLTLEPGAIHRPRTARDRLKCGRTHAAPATLASKILFAGSDCGGKGAAAIHIYVGSAKLNDSELYLRTVLAQITKSMTCCPGIPLSPPNHLFSVTHQIRG